MKHNFCVLFLLLFAYCCSAQVVVDTRSKFVTFSDTGIMVTKGSYCMKSKVAKLSYNSATKDYVFYGLDGASIDADNLNLVVFNGQRVLAAKEAAIHAILMKQLGDTQFTAGGGGGAVTFTYDSTTLSRKGIVVTNFPSTQTVDGTVQILNDSSTLSRRGVVVTNFPASQTISGSVDINNFPASQTVNGTVGATQTGTWNISDVTGTVSLPTGAATESTLAAINTKLPASLGHTTDAASLPVTLSSENIDDLFITGQAAQTAIINNILPAVASANATDATGYTQATVHVNSTGTAGTFIFEGSNNNVNFITIPVTNQLLNTGVTIAAAITATNAQIAYLVPINFRYIRLRIVTTITGGSIQAITKFSRQAFSTNSVRVTNGTASNLAVQATIGSGTITSVTTLANGQTAHSSAATGSPLRIGGRVFTNLESTLTHGDASDWFMSTSGQGIIKPFATPELDWYYFPPSGGLLNTTTPVSIKLAAGANIRNYITGLSIQAEPLTNATEFAIQLTGSATVLWKIIIPTTGLPLTNITFPTPLRSTANNGLEIVTLTASGAGAVYFNCQGYQAF
jgi:hypothetical protein